MTTIVTNITEIAEALGIPQYPAMEVVRRLFFSGNPIPIPTEFAYVTEPDIGNYSHYSPGKITVYRTYDSKSNIVDKPTLLAYIVEAVKSVMDITMWTNYAGPKAPEATGEPWEKPWERHYPLPGIYAVYPPTLPPADPVEP